MAQRFKASDLKDMIRLVVREEMYDVTKMVINEVLSERYLKQLVETSRPRGVSNLAIQGDETEEEVKPEVLDNDIFGVGQENPVFKKVPKEDHVRQYEEGEERNEMLSLFFEGTRPLDQVESVMEEGVPLSLDKKPVADMADRWKTLVDGANRIAESRRPMQSPKSLESEEIRLKMLRDQLDKKAV